MFWDDLSHCFDMGLYDLVIPSGHGACEHMLGRSMSGILN
jgi:hypothetical protein